MSPPPPGDKSPSQAEVEAYELGLEEVRKSMSATREVIEAARAKFVIFSGFLSFLKALTDIYEKDC